MQDRTRARFEAKVQEVEGCWVWTSAHTVKGYGSFHFQGRVRLAHRFAYEFYIGPIPDGLLVCHRCDNPPCVNPAHLFLGTAQDNANDAKKKGRTTRKVKLFGQAVPNARLTDAQALSLRAERRAGVSLATLAARYGISTSAVARACRKRPWMDAIDGGVPDQRFSDA